MGYILETISEKGDEEEDENGRVDAAVRTVQEWSVTRKE
jgi:hypothetical protein